MVYFVKAETGGIKIGFSVRLSVRLSGLKAEAGCPVSVLGVMDGGREVERHLHQQFAASRLHGVDEENPTNVRITHDVPDRIRRALNIRAARMDQSIGEVISELVLARLPDDLAFADEAIAAEAGRKPKPSA